MDISPDASASLPPESNRMAEATAAYRAAAVVLLRDLAALTVSLADELERDPMNRPIIEAISAAHDDKRMRAGEALMVLGNIAGCSGSA